MQGARDYLAGLAQLGDARSVDERRRVWRQGLAALAAAAENQRVAPLEGLDPDRLLTSLRIAFANGLVDDVRWMSPGLGAAALFELAAALPAGDEKRELGRRVLEALLTGDAATFVLLASLLAASSRRGLYTAPVRARIAVSMRLPIGLETGVDRLALALLCRPDLERTWLAEPSEGALPARRLAARVLERAAREAVRRDRDGDDLGLKTFRRPSVTAALGRLLADRESLVWRHAAAARGLLSAADEAAAEQIQAGLSPALDVTHWRRAAASLGAAVAHAPARAVDRCQTVILDQLLPRDPGLGAGLVFGLSRAVPVEPEAVAALLPLLLEGGNLETLEAFADLLGEHPGWSEATTLCAVALRALRSQPKSTDDGQIARCRRIELELSPAGAAETPGLRQHLWTALLAFVEGGDLAVHVAAAQRAAATAWEEVLTTGDDTAGGRRRGFDALWQVDRGLLESSLLADLMLMVGRDPRARTPGELGDLMPRLRRWLIEHERSGPPLETLPHLELHRGRLRALIHAIDGEGFVAADGVAGVSPAARERRLSTKHALLDRLDAEGPPSLRRPVCAALARACEGLVRDEIAEAGDVLVLLAGRLSRPRDLELFAILAEATLSVELKAVYSGLGRLGRRLGGDTGAAGHAAEIAQAMATLAEGLPVGQSAPAEALRRTLLSLGRASMRVAAARSLRELGADSGPGVLDRLGESVQDLAELVLGVARRLVDPRPPPRLLGRGPFLTLDAAVLHAGRGAAPDLVLAVRGACAAARADLPALLAEAVAAVLSRVATLPAEAPQIELPPVARDGEGTLPNWLPPGRVLGGFYVVSPIGRGTSGSVFIACRAEERHQPDAERFALKVPSYGGSVAHTLSEEEFLRWFRQEAGALLTLPSHPNLASFVTFDTRARPKPILVMELVDGPTLEQLLLRRDLTVSLVLAVLDGIAAGLGALHALGIGHLDVKPANVVLRAGGAAAEGRALSERDARGAQATPVLVDFGLAGRHVRPGCASPYYGAPEVWLLAEEGGMESADPAAADVYSFCCLGYELLTGRRLFDGETLGAVIATHFAHDGDPEGLGLLRSLPGPLARVAEVLSSGLRRDPAQRASIAELRAGLGRLLPQLAQVAWPPRAA